ncbi:hypothetical protein [Parapedobacter koreensis]|uniref:RHS repeat-associated core domain-containing protein n=1 Tax=Parapedobacter koreensis TaxID=332977 RepID=A0A1H7HWL8_9SPHI|nr:hypothetical protein [Parapedobacter koreensis]SEK54534.1 hypothetical protein SAMN05421740_10238 [Parapedobacter koreensis]
MRFIDPDGMAPRYNWDTGQYEEEDGKEVSWEYVGDFLKHNDGFESSVSGDDRPSKTKESNQGLSIGDYLGEVGVGLGIMELGANSWDKYLSTDLYKQGYRRGLNGNYLLTGRNLSLFGQQGMTSASAPMTAIGQIGKGFAFGGTVMGILSAIDDGIGVYKGDLSASRFGYRITGGGISLGMGFIRGAGPLGILVGTEAYVFEKTYDIAAPQMRSSFNQFYRSLINGWLNLKR